MDDPIQLEEGLSPDVLVERARALSPVLRARQEEAERTRRISLDSIRDMHAAGLYRILQPRHYGGLEFGLDCFVRVGLEIAAGCGSTGWVFATGAMHQWQIGMFDPAAQDDVWKADPTALAASSYAPTGTAIPTDGGYRLSGRWSFCSGIDICQWIILGVRIMPGPDAKAPGGAGFALVPKKDLRIEDVWHVFGLAGTGSNDIVLEDVFVPSHRILTHEQSLCGSPPGAAINHGPLYKLPFFAGITICLCTALLGMAHGARDEYLSGIRERTTRGAAVGGAKSITDFGTIQHRVGEASASIDAATALVLRDCREIMETLSAGKQLTVEQRARNKADLGFAVRLCVRAIDLLFDSVGGMGIYQHNRIQRYWRDLHAGSQHISVNWDAVATLYGRVQLGLPPSPIQF